MIRINCRFIFIVWIMCLAGCQTITEIKDPNNQYTPEKTFLKLTEKYPFIHIASRDVPPNVIENKNITYVTYGQRHLQLDLYRPKHSLSKKLPAIIFIHGGGWSSGYRTHFTPFAIALAQRGYVTATISYRLSPEAKYPAAIYDAKNALRWMRKNAKKWGVHPNQIVIAGGSAGGQIAALTGVTNGLPLFDGSANDFSISSDAQAIINIDGLSDFTSQEALFYENDPNKNPSAAGAWFGGRYQEVPEKWKQASPRFYVNEKTPPILFLISNEKRFSLGRIEMATQLSASHIFFQVVQIQNTPHSFWLFDPWLLPSVEAVDQFLKEQFK